MKRPACITPKPSKLATSILVGSVSTAASVAICYVTFWLFQTPVTLQTLSFAIIAPLLIAPLATLYIIGLYRRVFHLQAELETANDTLQQRNEDLEQALAQVKTLKGFIPICSVCRKIRNDDGYWNVLEEYVAQHTDAQLSHGICPECMASEYPEFSENITKKKKDPP